VGCGALPAAVQLASFAIVVNQLKNIYDAFFLNECERCRGTGLVTCPHVSQGPCCIKPPRNAVPAGAGSAHHAR
jgi:hypothetical protein